MPLSETLPDEESSGSSKDSSQLSTLSRQRLPNVIYSFAIVASIAVWFVPIKSPLWLDETVSFWQIHAGWGQISARQGLSRPAYSYILWSATKILGTSETALRMPSILAMLGAAWLLYLAARELFEPDLSAIAVVIFCLNPIVVFAAIDARPYACGLLAINAAIYCMLLLRRNDSYLLASLFGLTSALIAHFHLLFALLLPSLAICYFVLTPKKQSIRWKTFGIATAVFTLAILPVIPGFIYMFRTSGMHVFEEAPPFSDLLFTIVSPGLLFVFAVTLVIAAAKQPKTKGGSLRSLKDPRILACVLLGFVPLLILYGVSVGTSAHVFTHRYRLVAIPGIALFWAFALSIVNSRGLRLLFCISFVVLTSVLTLINPAARKHGYTWKYALEAAEQNASRDGAPVLICSDFPESDFMTMPMGDAVKDSPLFTPLSYYKLSVPVVGLPRSLTDDAIEDGDAFLRGANNQRFLAMGFDPSYETLDWLTSRVSSTHQVRELGTFDDIRVLEFTPLQSGDSSQ